MSLSRTWLLGLGLWCSADQSCYRNSRLMLCVVCRIWRGEEKEREEEQDGVGEERDRRKGGLHAVPVLKHLSLQLSPSVRKDHEGCPCYQLSTSIYDD